MHRASMFERGKTGIVVTSRHDGLNSPARLTAGQDELGKFMSVSFICSVTKPLVSRALVSIARLGAIRTAKVGSVHARTAVIGKQTRERAAVAFSPLKRVRSLTRAGGMLRAADCVSSPQRSLAAPIAIDPQIWITSQHVPPSCFRLFKITPMQPPFSFIEPHARS